MTLRELAERLECRLEGDGTLEIHGVAGIESACPGELTFLANPRYAPALRSTRASAVILRPDGPDAPCAKLHTEEPYLAFARSLAIFARPASQDPGVHPTAVLGHGVDLGKNVSIGAFVWIGPGAVIGDGTVVRPHASIGEGAILGRDCLIHSMVSIRERCTLGDRAVVQDGAVIGSDGFGFVRRRDGTYEKIPQCSLVVVEDDVEIGANTVIDRPAVGETRIRKGAKIDNLVQIAHGVEIGRNTMLAGQVGIAGSTRVGDDVVLAGQVGVAGHLRIGRGVVATAQTGIPNSLADGAFVSGYPAIENREWLKASAVFRRLPEIRKLLAALERRVAELERQSAAPGGSCD
jgi:UDP-3-O-[3-hydroxymyristoyl] glucosamine N-acyltransferase